MTIVVGYVPTPEGEAALTAAISEARLREQPLHIVNSARGDALVDKRFVQEDKLAAAPRQPRRVRVSCTRSTSRCAGTTPPTRSSTPPTGSRPA